METLLFGSFLTQYDAIQATFKEKEPFLNIDVEAGGHYYRVIIILKTLFVLYSIETVIPKSWYLITMLIGKLYVVDTDPTSILVFLTDFCLLVYGLFFPSMTILCMIPLTRKSYEFLIDVFVILCLLYYAVKTYKREIQKVSSLIFMGLFIHWYVNMLNTSPFSLSAYCQIIILLFITYFSLMPNRPKYRYRMTYFYVLMYLWIFYKLGQHYGVDQYKVCQNESKIGLCKEWQTSFEIERCNLNNTVQNLEKVNIVKSFHLNNGTQSYKQSLSDEPQKVTLIKTAVSINQEKVTNGRKLNLNSDYSMIMQNKGYGENFDIDQKKSINYAIFSNKEKFKNVITGQCSESAVIENEIKSVRNDTDDDQYLARKVDVANKNEPFGQVNSSESTETVRDTTDIAKSETLMMESGEVTRSVTDLSGADKVANSEPEIPTADEVADSELGLTRANEIADSESKATGGNEVADSELGVTGANELADSAPGATGASKVADNEPGETGPSAVAGNEPRASGDETFSRSKLKVIRFGKDARNKYRTIISGNVAGNKDGILTIGEVTESKDDTIQISDSESKTTGANEVADSEPAATGANELADSAPWATGASKVVDSEPAATGASKVADNEPGETGASAVAGNEPRVSGDETFSRSKLKVIRFGKDERNKYTMITNGNVAGNKDETPTIGEVAGSKDAAIRVSKVTGRRDGPIKIGKVVASKDGSNKIKVEVDKNGKMKNGNVTEIKGGELQIRNVSGRKSKKIRINVAGSKDGAKQLGKTPRRKTQAILINKATRIDANGINKLAGSESGETRIDKVTKKDVQTIGDDISRRESKAIDTREKTANKFKEFIAHEANNPENDKTKKVVV